MAEYTVALTDEQEAAGIYLLGTKEKVAAELQGIVNYTAGPWALKHQADVAASAKDEALAMKEKYAKLGKEDQDKVDVILAKADAVAEEPTP